METIEQWIIEDIVKSIKGIGFSIEEAPLPYLHATTNTDAKLIIYNRHTVTLFELAEEFIHARDKHTRHHKEYDVRNSDETEAHKLALQFLLDCWACYDGAKNWLNFVTVTGVPADFEKDIVDYFTGTNQKDTSFSGAFNEAFGY
ncbi:hypothetical protein JK159_07570 [Weissella minor]|uniref:hypothetical protein n=1 Tax=Weissella minor TaxID=1620 RepID=UPI001BAEF2F8|nr:hypothetical protein [Weissella minor]MBS0950219.1 hypothetical protein [Weissella minor]